MDSRHHFSIATAAVIAAGVFVACADTSGAGGTTVGSATTGMMPTTSTNMMGGAGGDGGAITDGGGGGEAGMGGMGGTGGVDTCPDQGMGEPNNTMATATMLPSGTDCDDSTGGTMGTIDGPNDVDWYMYIQTDDVFGCEVKPGRTWSQQAGSTIRVCKYIECSANNMPPSSVDCEDGSTPDEQGGIMGCCHTEPFQIGIGGAFEEGCPTSNDLLNVYTRVDQPTAPADACTAYNLQYHF